MSRKDPIILMRDINEIDKKVHMLWQEQLELRRQFDETRTEELVRSGGLVGLIFELREVFPRGLFLRAITSREIYEMLGFDRIGNSVKIDIEHGMRMKVFSYQSMENKNQYLVDLSISDIPENMAYGGEMAFFLKGKYSIDVDITSIKTVHDNLIRAAAFLMSFCRVFGGELCDW